MNAGDIFGRVSFWSSVLRTCGCKECGSVHRQKRKADVVLSLSSHCGLRPDCPCARQCSRWPSVSTRPSFVICTLSATQSSLSAASARCVCGLSSDELTCRSPENTLLSNWQYHQLIECCLACDMDGHNDRFSQSYDELSFVVLIDSRRPFRLSTVFSAMRSFALLQWCLSICPPACPPGTGVRALWSYGARQRRFKLMVG